MGRRLLPREALGVGLAPVDGLEPPADAEVIEEELQRGLLVRAHDSLRTSDGFHRVDVVVEVLLAAVDGLDLRPRGGLVADAPELGGREVVRLTDRGEVLGRDADGHPVDVVGRGVDVERGERVGGGPPEHRAVDERRQDAVVVEQHCVVGVVGHVSDWGCADNERAG